MPPKTKRKRTHVQLRTEAHPQQDAIVTCLEVTRTNNQQILTKLTKVSVPVIKDASQLPPLQTPDLSAPALQGDDSAPALQDDDSAPAAKKARKGPSRSVAVSLILLYSLPDVR